MSCPICDGPTTTTDTGSTADLTTCITGCAYAYQYLGLGDQAYIIDGQRFTFNYTDLHTDRGRLAIEQAEKDMNAVIARLRHLWITRGDYLDSDDTIIA
jgi:hypothetical protein